MLYQISRNGQMYGPYTLEDLRRYLASGNVLPTDLAKSETMSEWLPVAQILANPGRVEASIPAPAATGQQAATPATDWTPAAANPGPFAGAPAQPAPAYATTLTDGTYPEPPNLHWALVLLFSLLTCSLFMFVWNLIIASWLKRVQPNATSLFYYIGAAALVIVQVVVGVPYGMHHAVSPGMHLHTGNSISSLLGIAAWVVRLIARFSQRASLEEHFNGPEPIGLRLSGIMTFFFGGLYFQYHLNRISQMKIAARYGAIRPY